MLYERQACSINCCIILDSSVGKTIRITGPLPNQRKNGTGEEREFLACVLPLVA